jgi:hypothetical protein
LVGILKEFEREGCYEGACCECQQDGQQTFGQFEPHADDGTQNQGAGCEINADTSVPLQKTEANVVHTPELPARTGILGATDSEAKLEAEQLITHSRAREGSLYFDPSSSLQAGVGTLVATFVEGRGWQDS